MWLPVVFMPQVHHIIRVRFVPFRVDRHIPMLSPVFRNVTFSAEVRQHTNMKAMAFHTLHQQTNLH